MIQEPRISKHLSSSRVDLINETIQSHRYALSLNQHNADILFNTAQVLTTAAETAQETKGPDTQNEAITLLKEAVELFSSCLSRQELDFTENQAQAEIDPTSQDDDEGDLERMSTTSSQPPQEWATVLEPVTANTLVETALAELNTLTTLVTLTSSSGGPDSNDYRAFADVADILIQQKLPQYLALVPTTSPEPATPQPTARFLTLSDATPTLHIPRPATPPNPHAAATAAASLAASVFAAAVAEAEYRSGLSTAATYAARVAQAFGSAAGAAARAPAPALQRAAAHADALVAFAAAAADDGDAGVRALRGAALEEARARLAEAAALVGRVGGADADAPSAAAVALLRGDVEMMRRVVAEGEGEGAGADAMLEAAAGCYDSGMGVGGADEDEEREVGVKRTVVGVLRGVVGAEELASLVKDGKARMVVLEMEEEGLLRESDKKLAAVLQW